MTSPCRFQRLILALPVLDSPEYPTYYHRDVRKTGNCTGSFVQTGLEMRNWEITQRDCSQRSSSRKGHRGVKQVLGFSGPHACACFSCLVFPLWKVFTVCNRDLEKLWQISLPKLADTPERTPRHARQKTAVLLDKSTKGLASLQQSQSSSNASTRLDSARERASVGGTVRVRHGTILPLVVGLCRTRFWPRAGTPSVPCSHGISQ
jgi:hypothetical protein